MALALSDYHALVSLSEVFDVRAAADAAEASRLVDEAVQELLDSAPPGDRPRRIADDPALTPRQRLTALLTLWPPRPYLSAALHGKLDRLLQFERRSRPVQPVASLPTVSQAFPGSPWADTERLVLWQGDITTLAVDAIVNAANDALLGCFQPFHACIDNAIHTAAGPRLREDCDRLMELQGTPEPTGVAKVTRGFHLPARFVLHTVGPIVRQGTTDPPRQSRQALASSYRACLDLAAETDMIRTVAFCGISTGVFGFPAGPAAEVALHTVTRWLEAHPGALDRVVFNVFTAQDLSLYRALLEH